MGAYFPFRRFGLALVPGNAEDRSTSLWAGKGLPHMGNSLVCIWNRDGIRSEIFDPQPRFRCLGYCG